jgi:Kelch motif
MRRLWVTCVVLVLLAGCSYHSSAAQDAAYKRAFVHQLVGYCANVDRQLAGVNPATHPGQYAQQFGKMVSQVRSHRLPSTQRQQLNVLLSAFNDASRQWRAAQAAQASRNTSASKAALNKASVSMQRANTAAQRYGMPPLKDCPKKVKGGQLPPPVQAAGWRLGHSSPFLVQYAAAAELGGRIWVAGGLIGPKFATNKTEFYDPTLDTWSPGPLLPAKLHHATMVAYQGTLWLIGGFAAHGRNVLADASARVLKLDLAHGRWVDGPPLHHARAAAAAAVVGHKIVVVGGRTGSSQQLVKPTEIFDGTSWHDAAPIPVPGNHLAAASDGRYLYAVGGHGISETSPTAALQRFDPATGRWATLPSMPSPASGLGAAVVGGRLITVGGDNGLTVFSTVRAYNLATKAWSTLPSLREARSGMAVVAYRNILYALDGAAQPGHIASTNTVQILRFHR